MQKNKFVNSGYEWLGEIPFDWVVKKLKYLSHIGTGTRDTQDSKANGDFPFFVRSPIVERIAEYTHNEEAVMTAGDGAGVGKVFHYYNGKFSAHQRVYIFTEFKQVIGKYIYYYLKSNLAFEVLKSNAKSTVDSLRRPMLSEFPIAIPPMDMQQMIIFFLDQRTLEIDSLIADKEHLIELLEEKRKAIITEAVTKGLSSHIEMKDSGEKWIGQIPKHWTMTRLDFISVIKARLGWKALKANEYVNNGYIFLSTPNIKSREIDFENVNYITEERYLESPEIMLRKGDVLLVKDGSTLGITNIVRELPKPTTVNSSIAVIKVRSTINGLFLYYYLSSNYMQNVIQQLKDGMGVPHLFQSDIRKFKIVLPSIKEQTEITEYLEEKTSVILDTIKQVELQIEKLKEYRQSLIYEAVTGKIDVREYERSLS